MNQLTIKVKLDDGQRFETTTRTRDYVDYEARAKKEGWPPLTDGPSTWETFLAWRALLRDRKISMTWETFLDRVVKVSPTPIVDEDDEEDGTVTPFLPVAEAG